MTRKNKKYPDIRTVAKSSRADIFVTAAFGVSVSFPRKSYLIDDLKTSRDVGWVVVEAIKAFIY